MKTTDYNFLKWLITFLGCSIILILTVSEYRIKKEINSNAITRTQYNDMRKRLIISEALVKKCAQNDTIDIMQFVRDVKREMEVEFENVER